jgi:uncharacterized membrane protein
MEIPGPPDETAATQSRRLRGTVRQALVSGLAVVVPVLITIIVLTIAGRAVYNYLNLFANYLPTLPAVELVPGVVVVPAELLIELTIPVLLLVTILIVGFLVNSSRYGERAVDWFDYVLASIPGVGSVYDSFRQMSDVMLESDTQNFREVKLVEFPYEGAYTLGFVTTETPEPLQQPTGHDRMLTLFLPLAPNPVMGGHLVHMPAEKVMDVDMTVEEGIRAIVTSGVAVAGETGTGDGLSPAELRELGAIEHADQQFSPGRVSPDVRHGEHSDEDRQQRYEEQVSPEQATTPADLARREHDTSSAADDANATDEPEPDRDTESPADVADAEHDATERTPTELESTDETPRGDATTPEDIELDASRESTEQTPDELAGHERDEQLDESAGESEDSNGDEGNSNGDREPSNGDERSTADDEGSR